MQIGDKYIIDEFFLADKYRNWRFNHLGLFWLRCLKCGYIWKPKKLNADGRVRACPSCKQTGWRKPIPATKRKALGLLKS